MEVSWRRVLSGREGMLNRDGNKNCGKKDGFAEGASRAGRRDGGNRSRGGGEKDSTQRGEKDEGEGSEGDAGGLHTAVAVVEGDHGRAEGRDHGEVDRADREIVYSPLETQWKFHDSKARFKGFSGPIGSGTRPTLFVTRGFGIVIRFDCAVWLAAGVWKFRGGVYSLAVREC